MFTSRRQFGRQTTVRTVRISRSAGRAFAGETADLVDASGSRTARVGFAFVDVRTLRNEEK